MNSISSRLPKLVVSAHSFQAMNRDTGFKLRLAEVIEFAKAAQSFAAFDDQLRTHAAKIYHMRYWRDRKIEASSVRFRLINEEGKRVPLEELFNVVKSGSDLSILERMGVAPQPQEGKEIFTLVFYSGENVADTIEGWAERFKLSKKVG